MFYCLIICTLSLIFADLVNICWFWLLDMPLLTVFATGLGLLESRGLSKLPLSNLDILLAFPAFPAGAATVWLRL